MNAVEKTIFTDLGITASVQVEYLEETFVVVGNWDIAPSMCGPMAPMFDAVHVKVRAGKDRQDRIHLSYEYNYNHPGGGRNGFTVQKIVA